MRSRIESAMAQPLNTEEISRLSVEERLRLINMLWDSIDDPETLPVPDSHRRALDEALEDYERDPEAGQSWEEVCGELFPKG